MSDTEQYQSKDPRTGISFKQWPFHSPGEVQQALNVLSDAQREWSSADMEHRRLFCRKAEKELLLQQEQLAILASREMGKNIHESRSEVKKCAGLAAYCSEQAAHALKPERVQIDGAHAAVHYRPLGILLGVMPWNFPYWQVARFVLPALCAGNVCILKHAPNVQGCAEAFVDLVNAAAGQTVMVNLRLEHEAIEALIADAHIAGVSLTGSTRAGKAVAMAAGAAIKPTVLELGGNDPYLILEDADLDLATNAVCEGRMLNAGQSCISAKRIIVVKEIAHEFTSRISAFAKTCSFVSPTIQSDRSGDLAPMARNDLRADLHDQVLRSVAAGAKLEAGGYLPDTDGYFYPSTVLTKVEPGQPAFDEELFGPVFTIIEARDTAHAIDLANQSKYGLGAAVFSQNVALAEDIAKNRLQAGCCFVNAFVRSDARLPFGGIKESGYGRELSGVGFRTFTNMKTVYVQR